MSRRRRAIRRSILPDPIYQSTLVGRFINTTMVSGKKSIAETAVYKALEMLAEKTKINALEAFEKAMTNIRPLLEVKSRRVGGATYQVPIEVLPDRGNAVAIRWLLTYARKRGSGPIARKLAGELIDAFNNTGASVKKREDTHKMAEANRAFAHYKW